VRRGLPRQQWSRWRPPRRDAATADHRDASFAADAIAAVIRPRRSAPVRL